MTELFEIRFGTDGWRGIIARDFTMANVSRVSRALACQLHAESNGQRAPLVVVGYDARFMSGQFARVVAHALRHEGIAVKLTSRVVPTPALSWAVRHHGAQAGVMVTASHNPPEWNGIKLKGSYGGTALPSFTRQVEDWLHQGAEEVDAPVIPPVLELLADTPPRNCDMVDPVPGYLDQVHGLCDVTDEEVAAFWRKIGAGHSSSRPLIVVDPMYGAAQGLFPRVLRKYGFEVVELHDEVNPGLGGSRPEPIEAHLDMLKREVVKRGAVMGLATDGDGDRIGAVDENGRFVDAQYAFALLLDLLAGVKQWNGLVVKTFAVTNLVDRLCEQYGLELVLTPVGFKYVCELALDRDVLIGGEESGGIGVKNHIPERDGLACGLLLVELMVKRGMLLGSLVDELQQRHGPHTYRRIDLALEPHVKERLMELLAADPPRAFGQKGVLGVNALDGYRFALEGGGWILFRPSGTEPLVRVYAEADGPDELGQLLESGQRLVQEAE